MGPDLMEELSSRPGLMPPPAMCTLLKAHGNMLLSPAPVGAGGWGGRRSRELRTHRAKWQIKCGACVGQAGGGGGQRGPAGKDPQAWGELSMSA